MLIEYGKFYFIKADFFDLFKDYNLLANEKDGNKIPCFFCFKDKKDKDIIWFVPISTKHDKYLKIYENKKNKAIDKPVYNFVFGNVLGKKAVFLIQNIFPTLEKYIEKKYTTSNKDVEIPTIVKDEIIKTSLKVINLAQRGINIPFHDITEMKNILLKNKKINHKK